VKMAASDIERLKYNSPRCMTLIGFVKRSQVTCASACSCSCFCVGDLASTMCCLPLVAFDHMRCAAVYCCCVLNRVVAVSLIGTTGSAPLFYGQCGTVCGSTWRQRRRKGHRQVLCVMLVLCCFLLLLCDS
jgi:hypothetical protein